MKFEQAQICRRIAQTTASHRKLAVKRGTSVHKFDKGLIKDTHTDDVKSTPYHVSGHVFCFFFMAQKSFNKPFEFLLYKTNTVDNIFPGMFQ